MFAEQLFNAYLVYAARSDLTVELGETGPGKWSIISNSPLAYSVFRAESGGHCVQRVPKNGGGHKHTSYVTVVVSRLTVRLGSLKECDIEETFQRGAQKAGGQNVNKVNSAVRLKHKPTGLEVMINGRDQGKNRQTARQALAGKLEAYLKTNQTRASYAGAGRGDKIRTYNLQDHRVTDHRTGVKIHSPDQILKEGRFEMLN